MSATTTLILFNLGQCIDPRAAGDEIMHHLGRDFLRVFAYPFIGHAVSPAMMMIDFRAVGGFIEPVIPQGPPPNPSAVPEPMRHGELVQMGNRLLLASLFCGLIPRIVRSSKFMVHSPSKPWVCRMSSE